MTSRASAVALARAALRGRPLVLVGKRATDFAAVARLTGADRILSCEGGPDARLFADRIGIPLSSLEGLVERRDDWSNTDLASLIEFGYPGESEVVVLPYAATEAWERAAAGSAGRLLVAAPTTSLKRHLDDKIAVRGALVGLGLPLPESEVATTAAILEGGPARRLGMPLVVQERVGHGGRSTYIAADRGEIEAALNGRGADETWLVSRFAGAASFNVHGLVLEDRLFAAPPSIQIIGVPELARGFATYCGNDFGAASNHPERLREEARRLTCRVGQWLRSVGYRGLFGVDLVIDGSSVRLIEVNPRLQGSTWLLGELEGAVGCVPLTLGHLLHWLGQEPPIAYAETLPPGAFLMIQWTGSEAERLRVALEPGAHSLLGGRLVRRHPAVGLDECGEGEILVSGLPNAGALVAPGAVLARVASWGRFSAADGRSLTPFGQRVAAAVLEAVEPSAAPLPS